MSLSKYLHHLRQDGYCILPNVVAEPITKIVSALFGDFARISCTDCVINHPGNERGYWHADWPYN